MSDMKTVETDADPHAFLAAVAHPGRRADAQAVAAMMQRVTGWPPRMWGESIVGFGAYDYRRHPVRRGRNAGTRAAHSV